MYVNNITDIQLFESTCNISFNGMKIILQITNSFQLYIMCTMIHEPFKKYNNITMNSTKYQIKQRIKINNKTYCKNKM